MIYFKDETIIKASPERVYYFLTHIDKLYKQWHPKDHVFLHAIYGAIDKMGSIVHFFEWINRFPLYLVVQTTKVEKNNYLEYGLVFPFSLLKLGMGSFKIEKISDEETKLIAYVEGGYNTPIIGPALDFLTRKAISFDAIRKHMKEEGENIKKYLENYTGS